MAPRLKRLRRPEPLLAAALLLPSAGLAAQALPSVSAGFAPDEWLEADATVELRLSEPLAPGTGSLAVFLGETDLTALFEDGPERMTYRPLGVLLPAGEHELVVHHVSPQGQWSEVSRFPLRVLTRLGFQEVSFAPKLDVHNDGQVAEGHSPDGVAPPRATYQDFTFNTGLSTRHVRPGLGVRTQANVVGVSERERALRFGERQDEAPLFDLADYLAVVEGSHLTFSAGNVSFGASRHLVQGYGSRGLTAQLRPAQGAELSLAALGGRPVVGWQQPFGVGEQGSRILAASLGVDVVPSRPGMFRLDGTALDGAILPRAGFNQGAVTDTERSRGGSVRLRAHDPSGRLTLDAGYSRSRFDNPPDEFLSAGAELVPVEPETRDARYLDVRADLLRGHRLSPTLPASLAVGLRHERVEPLYRSVATYARADVEENAVEVTAGLGPVNVLFGHTRAEDNLDRIPSILTSLTRSHRASVALPLGALAGGGGSSVLPQVSYNLNRVHQFGEGVPENGGFDESHIPDQVSLNHGLRLDWFAGTVRLSYGLDRSEQDNRQPGRENADFEGMVHTASVGFSPARILDLGLDGSLEKAESLERGETARTNRIGGSADLRMTGSTALSLQAYVTRTSQDPGDAEQTSTDVRAQLSQGVTLHQRPGGATRGQLFVRFARQSATFAGFPGLQDPRRTWTVNTGFTLSLF